MSTPPGCRTGAPQRPPGRGPRGPGVIAEALHLRVGERVATFERFFGSSPGHGRRGLGLGTALADFLAWEVDSGRVADRGGSRWWKAVNGVLVLDVAAAAGGPQARAPAGPAAMHPAPQPAWRAGAAWRAYAAAPPPGQQAALWRAHAASLARAVDLAQPLLAEEVPAERELVAVVLRILDAATRRQTPTDGPGLGAAVRAHYPATYPARPDDVVALVRTRLRRDR